MSDRCECGYYMKSRHHRAVGGGVCEFYALRNLQPQYWKEEATRLDIERFNLRCEIERLQLQLAESQARVAELEAAQRWIPVSERLPISGLHVLGALRSVTGKYTFCRIIYKASATDHDWEADGSEVSNCWDVTHWRHAKLPEAPNE